MRPTEPEQAIHIRGITPPIKIQLWQGARHLAQTCDTPAEQYEYKLK
ncbi:hypothetical protein GCM10028773_61970 [Spirosoma koreense]